MVVHLVTAILPEAIRTASNRPQLAAARHLTRQNWASWTDACGMLAGELEPEDIAEQQRWHSPLGRKALHKPGDGWVDFAYRPKRPELNGASGVLRLSRR